MNNAFTRRLFLQRSMAVVSTTLTMPAFLHNSAFAIDNPFAYREGGSRPGVPDDRILVVVQLGGGNDGLNTVVPYGDPLYYNVRPQLGVRENQVLKFAHQRAQAQGIGLHANLQPLMELYDEGLVGLYQGVGYPNPNRSHFKSMDIWQTANPEGNGQGLGWIGRYFDNTCEGEPEPNLSISIGDTAPLAMQGTKIQPIAFENERLFRWAGEDLHENVAAAYQKINRAGVVNDEVGEETSAAFLMRTALDAQLSSDKIRQATQKQPEVNYPRSRLANSLKMVAQMIRAGLGTRVYYTDMGGFDTHANQQGRHAQLLGQFAGAVSAFYRDLKQQGNSSRVLILTFSEFGRRVKQNASAGTDHGTAAPMFMIGDMVEPGIHGRHPSLSQLDRSGDLVFGTDFRQIYTSVLNDWMGADAKAVLGQQFQGVPLIKAKQKV